MILAWKKRRTLHKNYDLVLVQGRKYAADIDTLAENMHILTVVDTDGNICKRMYHSKEEILREWEVVEGDL